MNITEDLFFLLRCNKIIQSWNNACLLMEVEHTSQLWSVIYYLKLKKYPKHSAYVSHLISVKG